MKRALVVFSLGVVVWGWSCSKPPEPIVSSPPVSETPPPEDVENPGSGVAGEENLTPSQLSGSSNAEGESQPVNPADLQANVLYARGGGTYYHGPIAREIKVGSVIQKGDWIFTSANSEFEVSLHTPALSEGALRLGSQTILVLEQPGIVGRPEVVARILGGQVNFFVPSLNTSIVLIETPTGQLESRGGIFTVVVSPQGQTLVSCREGEVISIGASPSSAVPGQVLILDGPETRRLYALNPDQASVFQDRWLKVMTEEAPEHFLRDLEIELDRWTKNSAQLTQWNAANQNAQAFQALLPQVESSAAWMTKAKDLLKTESRLPSDESILKQWSEIARIRSNLAQTPSVWVYYSSFPGLLGVTP